MKTLLVLNAGSSSLKFAVFRGQRKIMAGLIDQIGGRSQLTLNRAQPRPVRVASVRQAMSHVAKYLKAQGVNPRTVAHRIVHGGWLFDRPTKLTPVVVRQLKQLVPLAPLHLPANLLVVSQAKSFWPQAKQWAVFDTALYRHLPPAARLYALPLAISQKFHIQKYGFHGISHDWAFQRGAERLKKAPGQLSAVTVHLGAGDSITLWKRGRAADTSMGFTPLEGLTMSTRSGDLDPFIPLFLQRHGYSRQQVETILEQRSGLFGLTGLRDMRDILDAAGHPVPGWPRRRWPTEQRQQARLAVDMFIYDLERYLGSYLGQVQSSAPIILTGSIGQNHYIQRRVRALPIARGRRLLVVPAAEEKAIAQAVGRVVK